MPKSSTVIFNLNTYDYWAIELDLGFLMTPCLLKWTIIGQCAIDLVQWLVVVGL